MNERTWSAALLVAGVAGMAYLFAKSKREGVLATADVDGAKDIAHGFNAAAFVGDASPASVFPSLLAAEPPPVFAGDVHVDAFEHAAASAYATVVGATTSSAIEVAVTDPASSSTVTTQDLAPAPYLIPIASNATSFVRSNLTKINNKALLADRGPDSRAIPLRLELGNFSNVPWKGTLTLLFSETGYPDNVTRTERVDSSLEIPAREVIEAKLTYGLVAQHRNPATWSTPTTKPITVRIDVRIDDKSLGVHEFKAI